MNETPARPGICFTAIVKDEESVIRRCLESVKPHITCWVISDTGSSDATPSIIQEVLEDIPGHLRRDKWQDFATNRNLALEEARELALTMDAKFIMTLDADEELVMPEGHSFAVLDQDGYVAPFKRPNEDSGWHRTFLVKAALPFRYVGAVHEQLTLAGARIDLLADVQVISHLDGARQSKGETAKYKADTKILRRLVRKDPKDARSWFYLARSLASCGKLEEAIVAYRKRITMDGGQEEIFHSLYQIAALKEMRGDHWLDVARAYQEAYTVRPFRAEPLWALAVLHRQAGELALAELYARHAASLPYPVMDGLFISRSIYDWRALDDLSTILARTGKIEECKAVLKLLIEERADTIPPEELTRMVDNFEDVCRMSG